jgi:hypothetical protein
VPRAIAGDGTLYVTASHLERAYAIPAGTVLALAGPSAPRKVALPDARRQGPLVAGLRIRPARFRTSGPVSLCPAAGAACRPATRLGSTISFTLRREAAVSLIVRRVGDGRVVARLDRRVLPGTTWRSALDLTPLPTAAGRALAPGRYTLTARAAAGAQRVTAGPVPFAVVR